MHGKSFHFVLQGVPKERIENAGLGMEFFSSLQQGKSDMNEKGSKFYKEMCKDILSERARLGGNWAIAQAVPSRSLRHYYHFDPQIASWL